VRIKTYSLTPACMTKHPWQLLHPFLGENQCYTFCG
jgi:hypothetical protein